VDPVPDLLPLRKTGSAGNRTRDHWIYSQELLPLEDRGGKTFPHAVLSTPLLLPPSPTLSVRVFASSV
jgi:hypothetical protein